MHWSTKISSVTSQNVCTTHDSEEDDTEILMKAWRHLITFKCLLSYVFKLWHQALNPFLFFQEKNVFPFPFSFLKFSTCFPHILCKRIYFSASLFLVLLLLDHLTNTLSVIQELLEGRTPSQSESWLLHLEFSCLLMHQRRQRRMA